MKRRAAGLLLHPTSLPGPFGIGDLGPSADRFLEWAEAAGQKIWQVLPLGPTGGPSPYGALSAFAGNQLLLSPERLVEEGLLPSSALADAPRFPPDRVAWESVHSWKDSLLRFAWRRAAGSVEVRAAIAAFREATGQRHWLPDWSLFAARRVVGESAAAEQLSAEEAYQEFLQFLFHSQWQRLRREAERRGIALFGDVPIYVSRDSVEVASRPDLFDLDAEGNPVEVAGVPPDYFSETGQLWGYPLYRWDRMAEEGFAWWIARLRSAFERTDLVRLDHFRGFAEYWAVPAGEPTAAGGRWRPGPGRALFDAVARELGDAPLVAEDLGTITSDVQALLDETGIPGMKVLQFAFYGDDGPYLPHRHLPNSVVYTGTHDNDTARGWWEGLTPEERERVRDYLGSDGTDIARALTRAAYASVADVAIVPVQDVFDLGGEARMNTPGEGSGNWSWRALPEQFTPERARHLRRLASLTGR